MTDYSRIFASAPANATAAKVVSRSGEVFNPNIRRDNRQRWDAPPPTIPIPENQPQFTNLTGVSYGRMRVIGYHGKSRWVVRCTCGDYELRSSKAILNPLNAGDRCFDCQYIEKVKQGRGNSPVKHLMEARS